MVQKNKTPEDAVLPLRTLSLDGLRSFVAICETGSFRRAAQRVNKSPSAVSLQIAKLEELLGIQLLMRDARRVTLTQDGSALLGQARLLLGINDETIALFHKNSVAGRLYLAAPHDLGVSFVPRFLGSLAGIYPDLCVDVRLGTTNFVKTKLAEGRANIGLFNDIDPVANNVTTLYAEPLVWMTKKGGRAAHQEPLPLAVAKVGCAWRDAALGALDTNNQAYRVAYSSDTSMGQVAAVRADLAIAALPASLSDDTMVEAPRDLRFPPLPNTNVQVACDESDLAKACVAFMVGSLRQKTPFCAE